MTNNASKEPTKRETLRQLAKIYDPLGLASPITLQGKIIYRDVCDAKLPWDAELNGELRKRWSSWEQTIPAAVTVPRPIAPHREPIMDIHLHAFGDASNQGVCAAVYVLTKQDSGNTQMLVAAKSRLAKRGLTIPRLELVAGHMAANLITNVAKAIGKERVTQQHCWLDSTVALYWIQGAGEYRQFVANRVVKIQAHSDIEWHHVPTDNNPSDLGSRGGQLTEPWLKGPPWLSDKEKWPESPLIRTSPESQAEAKVTREVLAIAATQPEQDDHTNVLEKYSLQKTLRIGAWVKRFVHNSRSKPADRKQGPLQYEECLQEEMWWVAKVQKTVTPEELERNADLNLQDNENGLLECRGRTVGHYPLYLPDTAPFSKKLVEREHSATLHGGTSLTMTRVRQRYWIPRLRSLVKRVRKNCWRCKRNQAKPYEDPAPGPLPTSRTTGNTPYSVVGVDFADPIRYRSSKKQEGKAYLALFACSLTRGVHLELLKSLETEEFLQSFKHFVARRGRPTLVYCDNGSTFKAGAAWLEKVRKDEKFHAALCSQEIRWRFNLAKAPWWGGQFERLIGIFKSAFRKSVGGGLLTFSELQEIVLDVETCMNNRPLTYFEDDPQLPVMTPNMFLFQRPQVLPELQPHQAEQRDLRKRLKFLRTTKDALWKRWTREYLTGLRERHKARRGTKSTYPKEGEIVIIKGEDKNRNTWKLGKVVRLITGRDGVVQGVKLQTVKGKLEQPIQLIYPLELQCDEQQPAEPLNPQAEEFKPMRKAAQDAQALIKAVSEYEQEQ